MVAVGWQWQIGYRELFGPILPIVPVENVDEAIKYVNDQYAPSPTSFPPFLTPGSCSDHPLALYVFSTSTAFKNKVFDNTQSGACIANECLLHPGADGLPFGGTGQSGCRCISSVMYRRLVEFFSAGYHTGKYSFDMFTHLRASLDSPSWYVPPTVSAFTFPSNVYQDWPPHGRSVPSLHSC